MENKKAVYPNPGNTNASNEVIFSEQIQKHPHQHPHANPQQLRLLQYGLKIPNHAHPPVSQPIPHVHIHRSQSPYQTPSSYQTQFVPQQLYANPPYHPHHPKQNQSSQQPVHVHPQYISQPPPLHPHNINQLNQQSPQSWVPHQPPGHYHPQQHQNEQSRVDNQTSRPVAPTLQQSKPKDLIERKKSAANTTQLRSPSAKRPMEAPVTLQGWLHKQGSEGLMLWKKRWFVLSEFCLFYYKGPEEEKLLGSILLPSYKVSICGPDDKVNKKYAFKCEHTNMRTYVLAADSLELMMEWVRALDMASQMQSAFDEKNTIRAPTDENQNSGDQLQHVIAPRNAAVHLHSSSNTTDISNPSQSELNRYSQPLYANAPPKPRRLTDGYTSSSPDILDRYSSDPKYVTLQPPQPYNPPVYVVRTTAKSPINIYGNPQVHSEYFQHNMHHQPYNIHMTREAQYVPQNTERRTPDTYGRSMLNVPKTRYPSDYEEVYGDQTMYKRPLSPISYNNNRTIPPQVKAPREVYGSVKMRVPRNVYAQQPKPVNSIPRPHSADFLEYEIKHQDPNVVIRQQPRPKSSLDININQNGANDNYFYSEERYAEKMRKSVQYLPKITKDYQKGSNIKTEGDSTFPLIRSSTQPMNYNIERSSRDMYLRDPIPVRSRSVLSDGSLSKELDTDFRTRMNSGYDKGAVSPAFRGRSDHVYGYSEDMKRSIRDYDNFTRSASARLAQGSSQMEDKMSSKEGERKREESMKRLLEWKQRMLQSPLNRKVSQGIGKRSGGKSNYCRNHDGSYPQSSHMDGYLENVHSSNAYHPQYNSYSSDDEENMDGSKENVQTQAGWTTDTIPSTPESHVSALNPSTTEFTSAQCISDCTQTSPPQTFSTNNNLPVVSTAVTKNQSDELFEKPLKIFNKQSTHTALVSSLKSEFANKFEITPSVTEIKSNGALVKSILAEFETKTDSISSKTNNDITTDNSTSNVDALEENYMNMTPKKSIFETLNNSPFRLSLSCETENDESPYVEMTQNAEHSLLKPSTEDVNALELQPYETVCFSKEKMEPVYVELNQLLETNKPQEPSSKKELPDILITSNNKGNKSDSSDADDEASKDFDSLDTPCHPRFSLSDTFRPASYYLGASRTAPEQPDSSDSELVSPPPIPTSPPPMDELENTDTSLTFNNSSTPKYNSSVKEHDNSSLCSISGEYERKYGSRMSQNSDSDIELRAHLLRDSSYERMLKRRPVSEEFYDELRSLNSSNAKDLKLDLPIAENSDISEFHDYENMYMSQLNKSSNSNSNIASSSLSAINYVHSRENSRDTVTSQMTINSGSQHSTRSCNDYLLRARPESNNSLSAEISGFLCTNSSRSTPLVRPGSSVSVQELTPSLYFSLEKSHGLNSIGSQPAPYYYSDLSINTSRAESNSSILTLNNQRESLIGNKRDITHIVNPIRRNNRAGNSSRSSHQGFFDNRFKLAAEARSASVDFLNIADKSGNIDKKNIYESDTLKRLKMSVKPERNFFPNTRRDKFGSNEETNVRRSYSLEGLLENVLNENIAAPEEFNNANLGVNEGSQVWEEDSVWRERLRSASQRHTRSLDDLDCVGDNEGKPKKQLRGISRMVTYVNDNMFNMPFQDKQQLELEDKRSDGEGKERISFIIDREKLRQWDFLSSAPSDAQLFAQSFALGNNSVVDMGAGVSTSESSEQTNADYSASGSISINTRDTFPRVVSGKKATSNLRSSHSKSNTNIARSHESDYTTFRRPQHEIAYSSQGPSQNDLSSDTSQSNNCRRANWQLGEKMNVSAGELLGRTHEELVLLLIQLRRQNANTCNAIEACYNEIDTIQNNLPKMDAAKRLENLQKLEQIKQHLLELEKQYEKGKPLVNLVDNMVKLGSLYKFPKDRSHIPHVRDRLEFNQQIQERRLLAEERKDWNRLNSNHTELQAKVQQLYQLDQLIQEESETLQNLQHDKEDIERALGGLRIRLNKGFSNPAEIEQARKQQIVLENELIRVHSMLAQNSRKLEETVAGNARLEQELLVLKQKLQISRQQRSSPQISNAGDSLPCVVGTSAMLESDLYRVQQKVGDLRKQRQELSMQVRQLTDRSNNLQQWRQLSNSNQQMQGNKKKVNSLWRETDLDTMSSIDHGESWDNSTPTLPLYINTDAKHRDLDIYGTGTKQSELINEEIPSQIPLQEKQEIKTVRIVKRESERRQRDREKTITGKWDQVIEEDDSSQNSSVLFAPAPVTKTQSSSNLELLSPTISDVEKSGSGVPIPSLQQYAEIGTLTRKSPELSPIFKSEAARQIIIEMSAQDIPKPSNSNRRAVPKEKRRHYTAPNNNLIMKSLNQLPIDDKDFDKLDLNSRRARDDLDMERALRQRIDAPDVVRSTLSNKELKYNENTIDSLLGTPNKIFIPERYVPEQLPQLSAEEQQHRLRKVESIKKMLSDTTIISGSTPSLVTEEVNNETASTSNINTKATTKMIEEKKQREHLLQLNQILAKQVMEMSKIVAVKALASLPLEANRFNAEDELSSPEQPLPIYQQRDNFYS